MRFFQTTRQARGRHRCDDVAEVLYEEGVALAFVADGARGVGLGHLASERFADEVRSQFPEIVRRHFEPGYLKLLFGSIDRSIASKHPDSETTGVLAVVVNGEVRGCSVGDSEAWIVGDDGTIQKLTSRQSRKPRLGGAGCKPVEFGPTKLNGTLLMGSDGLFMFNDESLIASAAIHPDPHEAVDRLMRIAKPDDDASVIVLKP